MNSHTSLPELAPQGTKRKRSPAGNDKAATLLDPRRQTWRVRGVPLRFDKKALARALRDQDELQCANDVGESNIADGAVGNGAVVHTLAQDLSTNQVATVRFAKTPTRLAKLDRNGELLIKIPTFSAGDPNVETQDAAGSISLTIDQHFNGITVLSCPPTERPEPDILAVHGLGGHPFGSFAHKSDGYMWLSESLPKDMPMARVIIYGYESRLQNSNSFANLGDLARSLKRAIYRLRSDKRRIILIGHSLGGLIIKDSLIQMVREDSDKLKFILGIVFFGVPNDGMNIEALIPMVGDQPNRALLDSISSINSQVLNIQKTDFAKVLRRTKLEMFCFYETEESPTAKQDSDGKYKIRGPRRCLVAPASARGCLPSGQAHCAEPIARTHSELVKFTSHDDNYETVRDVLNEMYRKVIASEADLAAMDDHGAQSGSPSRFSLPLRLLEVTGVVHFIARTEELEKLHAILGKTEGRRTAILHGLGGMGKTQLAIAYLKRYQANHSAILWLNARDKTSLQQSFMRAAEWILHYQPRFTYIKTAVESRDPDAAVKAVKQWLDELQNDGWLLVYDNYDDPSFGSCSDRDGGKNGARTKLEGDPPETLASRAFDIRPFFPDGYHGAILVTTRSSAVKLGEAVQLGKLRNIDDSLAILASTSHRQDLKNDAAAVQVAACLDGLPLALSSAGAYLDQVSTSWADYLKLYQGSWLQLQKASPQLLTYDYAMFSTWNISFRHIERQNRAAAKLLRLWAYFSNEDLWYELLKRGRETSEHSGWLTDLTNDRITFDNTMRLLCSHGLVDADPATRECGAQSRGYNVHACVHSWMKHVLNPEIGLEMAQLAIDCIAGHVPGNWEPEYWWVKRRLVRHADRSVEVIKEGLELEEKEQGWAFYNLGVLYAEQGRVKDAEEMYQRSLQGKEKAWGPEHTSTLNTVNSLGVLYAGQGRLKDAQDMLQRALQGKEKAQGPEHTSTLDTVNNLGSLYTNQGRLEDAEEMYQRALQGYEKAWGPEHTSTLDTVISLGSLYRIQGRLEDAEEMFQRALQGYEKAWGPEHTSTLCTVNNLGTLYMVQGRLKDAEEMYQRALRGKEKVYAPEHVSTLSTVSNLGTLYKTQGRLKDAEEMCQRALLGYEKAVGDQMVKTYPPALNTLENLAALQGELGKIEEARLYYTRAADGAEKVYGVQSERYRRLVLKLQNIT